ncbi:uncharacterized protein ACHE_80210S [Aspergillus chevalieri]|uniref:Retrotransposon gag domain-containing protein n=1 Tax=Aspergillus chevalieri TaxID=182096 RepID=A0A7R7ZK40_ASPCH|nr:uncharacterized protein ACHE_10906S [Aspergillus chevalieri]XP_043133545.1 uncharacterized protein ACHE_20481S [Aspergillus chevalieri]XP_043133812.1 uncharacterized protein ACHE_20748S [Aspergillus chevalieri]XP_043134542.1 uncharacterized protein ACHE_30007A [Aspergillus chevalieri]XP_043135331.1 uncharacterized protein ACHE_30796A [Aspergillus chevalieri]XP_043138640.1 uncharacterized protein ACHE_60004A [Aspergillus chevalieri]XP_043140243.1 uncharacterized protein ACHE_70564S [Aspergi
MDPFQELRNEFSSTIRALQNEIESVKNEPKPLQRPKPCLPDPEKFNGQSLKFDTWLASMKAKLRIDAPAIGDAVAQFYYVYLNLESKVQALVLPQLSYAEDTNTWDYNTILDQLSLVYDNPNKVQEAEDYLLVLKQDSGESVAAYIAKFERILYEAKGKDWPDVTKISAFRKGLNPTLRGRLNQQLNLPKSYTDFLRVVQQLGSHSFSSNSTNVSHSQSHQSGSHTKSDPMDLSVININSLSAASTSLDERNRRRQQGSCVRCGSSDHWVKDCSMKAHKESNKIWNQQMIARLEANRLDDLNDLDD